VSDSFDLECDRLSQTVDCTLFERLRWEKHEGPMLARLVDLAQISIKDRSDFDLVEEGASRDEKRFVLKVHGNRIAALSLSLNGAHAVADIVPIDRSRFQILPGDPASAEFVRVDEAWMAHALRHLFSRIAAV
jgi:hypothetical protein